MRKSEQISTCRVNNESKRQSLLSSAIVSHLTGVSSVIIKNTLKNVCTELYQQYEGYTGKAAIKLMQAVFLIMIFMIMIFTRSLMYEMIEGINTQQYWPWLPWLPFLLLVRVSQKPDINGTFCVCSWVASYTCISSMVHIGMMWILYTYVLFNLAR